MPAQQYMKLLYLLNLNKNPSSNFVVNTLMQWIHIILGRRLLGSQNCPSEIRWWSITIAPNCPRNLILICLKTNRNLPKLQPFRKLTEEIPDFCNAFLMICDRANSRILLQEPKIRNYLKLYYIRNYSKALPYFSILFLFKLFLIE